jgi:hypothetical protein
MPAVGPSNWRGDERHLERKAATMGTFAEAFYRDSTSGVPLTLPRAGTALEIGLVYDATAREIKAMAKRGLVEIVRERRHSEADDAPITELVFVKVARR